MPSDADGGCRWCQKQFLHHTGWFSVTIPVLCSGRHRQAGQCNRACVMSYHDAIVFAYRRRRTVARSHGKRCLSRTAASPSFGGRDKSNPIRPSAHDFLAFRPCRANFAPCANPLTCVTIIACPPGEPKVHVAGYARAHGDVGLFFFPQAAQQRCKRRSWQDSG